jgi:hypothetical protein
MSVVIPSLRGAIAVPGWAKNELWRRARAVPSLDLRFADNKSLADAATGASLVTFTRASSGTYVGSDGVLQTAATDVPRFDHNPTTGESLGLLVEEQRTNLLLRSEEFQTTWSPINVTVSTDTSTSPTGSLTADTITPAASTAAHLISQTATVVASTPCTASVYIKSDGAPFVQVAFDNGSSVGAFINVNTSTGAITRGPDLAGGATNATGSVVSAGNGWYRVSVGATHSGTIGRILISPLPATSSTASINPSTTTAATDKVLLWGAQLEAGAFPTSYIPTTTAAVTRSADVASITGSAFSGWYRQDEGTVFGEGVSNGVNGVGFFTLEDGSAAEYSRMGVGFSLLNFIVSKASGSQADVYSTGTSFVFGAPFRGVAAYALNNVGLSLNGANAQVDTTADMPSAANVLKIGFGKYATYTNGTFKRLTYWPTRLANSTLQNITA